MLSDVGMSCHLFICNFTFFECARYTELNCEYITKICDLPFYLEYARCSRLYIKASITSLDKEPALVSIDHLDLYVSLEKPPKPREESEILNKDVYHRLLKLREKKEVKKKKKEDMAKKEALKKNQNSKESEKTLENQKNDQKNKKNKGDNNDDMTQLVPSVILKSILFSRVELKSVNIYIRSPRKEEEEEGQDGEEKWKKALRWGVKETNVSLALLLQLQNLWVYSTDPNWNVCFFLSSSFFL